MRQRQSTFLDQSKAFGSHHLKMRTGRIRWIFVRKPRIHNALMFKTFDMTKTDIVKYVSVYFHISTLSIINFHSLRIILYAHIKSLSDTHLSSGGGCQYQSSRCQPGLIFVNTGFHSYSCTMCALTLKCR